MYRQSDDNSKSNTYNSILKTYSPNQSDKKMTFQSHTFSLKPMHEESMAEHRKNSIDEELELNKKQKEKERERERERQTSLSINIKSSARQLIESKEYENKLSNQWNPVFPEFTQEESVDMIDSAEQKNQMYNKMIKVQQNKRVIDNYRLISPKNVKRVESKWLEDQVDRKSSTSQQFIKSSDFFTSSQDVQKLSQIYNEFLIKNDSKNIKKLNSTNQQLKAVCKQIVSLLKQNSNKSKVKDDLIIGKIYKIITNYQSKTNAQSKKK